MRHILLAVAAIGAVSAVALSVSSKPIADSGNYFNALPTSYSMPAGADPSLSGAPEAVLAAPAPPAPGAAPAVSTAAGIPESTAESASEWAPARAGDPASFGDGVDKLKVMVRLTIAESAPDKSTL